MKLHYSILVMAYYHVHGIIPDTLSQSEGYKLFEQYIASGAPKDKFDGFELIDLSVSEKSPNSPSFF